MLRCAAIAVALAILAFCPGTADAQTCPSTVQTTYYEWAANHAEPPIAIDLLPCQTLVVEMSGSGSELQNGNMYFDMEIRNSTPERLAWNSVTCGVTCSISVPSAAYLPGTRGEGGLAKDLVARTGACNWYSTCLLKFTLVIRKTARPGYNTGGDSFGNAPLIPAGEPQYGGLSDHEASGQYYKITLQPGQAVYVSGYVTRLVPTNASVTIKLYDANFVEKKTLASLLVANETKTYPSGSTPTLFTHPGTSPADYYLRIRCGAYLVHDFQMIVEVPRLEVTPNPVTRGEQATFRVRGALGATISNWSYVTADNGTVTRTVNVSADTWPGIVVDSGTGHVTVTRGTNAVSLEADLEVAPRSGWTFTAKAPSKEDWIFTTPGGLVLDPANPPDGSYGVGGEAGVDLAWSPASTYRILDNGPNHDFKFVSTQITDTGMVPTGFYWVIVPDLENTVSEFFLRQCGNFNPATQTGFISGENLATQTVRHERAASQSHYAHYVAAQNDPANNLGVYAEQAVVGPSTTLAAFGTMVLSGLNQRVGTIVTSTKVEPYGVNRDENNTNLGSINFSPTYATCP
jgi:hypothetical protein